MFVCSFTGHRNLPIDKLGYIRESIMKEVHTAIREGYAEFWCGFASGGDLEFAQAVTTFRDSYPYIKLIAVLPYRDRMLSRDEAFSALIKQANKHIIVSEKYSKNCFALRNKKLAENAELMLALYDGREKTGTAQTIRYAAALGVKTRIIHI